ncbi:MAG: hypothetical protein B9S32_08010 [Verrucomicrobia bacterium Tous-C9LFEB]|nr:MAG: hypothetical protein B9S32_08010 [Verrucomicrobia bacterium Tous-C9LFEB]
MDSGVRVVQKELAQALKLSQSTISRALANSPLLSPVTREKVQQAAARLGYVPDPVLSSLNAYVHSKRPISQGTVLAWLGNSIAPPLSRRQPDWEAIVFVAARNRAAMLGYGLEYFSLHEPKRSLGVLDRILWSRGVGGLVIGPQPRPHARILLDIARWCAVTVSKTLYTPKVDQISVDHGHEISTCYRKLRGRGYRRIGLVLSHTFDEKTYGLWRGGYLVEQSRRHVRNPIPVLVCSDSDNKTLVKWMERHRPDSVITAFEGNRRRLDALRTAHYRVPHDVGLAFLNLGSSSICNSFSGMEEPNDEIGHCAIDVLVSRIRNNQRGLPNRRIVHLLEGIWKDGNTVRQASSPTR